MQNDTVSGSYAGGWGGGTSRDAATDNLGRTMQDKQQFAQYDRASAATEEYLHRTQTKQQFAGLPVAIVVVQRFKELEERVLRELDNLTAGRGQPFQHENAAFADQRCVATARTYLQTGFMWAARAIFQPQRIALPGDETVDGAVHQLEDPS